MILFPNVIAGILIGITNDTWFARLIIPFMWGIIFCFYTSFFRRDERDAFILSAEMHSRKAKWRMSHKQAFYFVEYMTAVFTSLLFSIISGFVTVSLTPGIIDILHNKTIWIILGIESLAAFLIMLNGFLRGRWKHGIDAALSIILIIAIILMWVFVSWKFALFALAYPVIFAAVTSGLAKRIAMKLLKY